MVNLEVITVMEERGTLKNPIMHDYIKELMEKYQLIISFYHLTLCGKLVRKSTHFKEKSMKLIISEASVS